MLTATDEKNLFEVDATAVKIEKGSIDDFENISLDADQKASTPYYVTVKIRTRVRTCGNDAAQDRKSVV